MKMYANVKRPAKGPRVVTLTLVDGNLSAKWSGNVYGTMKQAAKDGHEGAARDLEELRAALAELDLGEES